MIDPAKQGLKLTIGFVLDDGLNKPDGVQQNILTLGEWFSSRGHEVHYLVGETTRTDITNLHVLSKNLNVHFNGNTLSTPFPAKISRIRHVLEQNSFDILHVQIPYSPFMSARILRRADARTAVIGTFHILPVGRVQHLLTRFLGLWLKTSLKRFDKFFSVSAPTAKFARQTFHIESSIMPNPVNSIRFQPAVPKKHTDNIVQIVFLGRLVQRKGCLELLRAIDYLVRQKLTSKNFQVHICGDGSERKKLEQFVQKKNLSKYVIFHGFVSEMEKIKQLQSADLAVFPSISGESFGIVLLEAMAAKAGVVLAGNNPGYQSVLGNVPESMFDPNETKALTNLMLKYIEDPDERRSLYAKQQQLAANFDVGIVGTKLLKTYEDCINHRNGR